MAEKPTVLVRFFNDGPTIINGVRHAKGAHVPLMPSLALEVVRSGAAEFLSPYPPNAGNAHQSRQLPGPPEDFTMVWDHPDPSREVAVLIPAHNPGERHLQPCLESLSRSDAAPCITLVFVDDGSEPSCADEAAALMREFDLKGKVLRLGRNAGYNAAMRLAAAHASAQDHVLLYSVDMEAPREKDAAFLVPMIERMGSDERIGIVGNLHRKAPDQTRFGHTQIDSAGSEWSWETRSYQHRGRDGDVHHVNVTRFTDLDMVTSGCALVRMACWDELGGLSPAYRGIGWDDTELCLSARRRGWRVVYEPKSEVVHFGRHTLGQTDWTTAELENRMVFHSRWMQTGLVEGYSRRRGVRADPSRLVVGMMVLNEEEFVADAIESVYADVDEIDIVVGAVPWAVSLGAAKEDGSPTDATLDIVRAFSDPDDKLRIVGPLVHSDGRRGLRNTLMEMFKDGDFVVMLDGDEVMRPDMIWRIFADLRNHHALAPRREDHWNDFSTLGAGSAWEGVWEPRFFRHRSGMRCTDYHHCPEGCEDFTCLDYAPFAHYCYVKPVRKLRQKFALYEASPIVHETYGPFPSNYVDRVFLPWRDDPGKIEGWRGTHPFGGGHTRPFEGRHPPQIEKRLLSGELPGKDW